MSYIDLDGPSSQVAAWKIYTSPGLGNLVRKAARMVEYNFCLIRSPDKGVEFEISFSISQAKYLWVLKSLFQRGSSFEYLKQVFTVRWKIPEKSHVFIFLSDL